MTGPAKSKKKLRRPPKPRKSTKQAKPLLAAGLASEIVPSNGRQVPAHMPQPGPAFGRQVAVLRKIAATDFIVDPDGHSIRWHYERSDRLYEKTVAWRTFEGWALKDNWTTRRDGWWEQIEARVRDHMGDEILRRRLRDLEKLERRIEVLDRFLEPLVDEHGELRLSDDGLPTFGLKLPDMDKFVGMYLKLHERVMLLRGEATSRTEQTRITGDDSPLNEHLRDRSRIAPKITRMDARAMARAMLEDREPALGGSPGGVIDAPSEDYENDDDGSDDDKEVSDGGVVQSHESGG